ncbi:MAG: hypothetical protein LC647_06100, partial [Beggiatoa sp.]|nr:hypothetical protein [Beggiatoa sp.]
MQVQISCIAGVGFLAMSLGLTVSGAQEERHDRGKRSDDAVAEAQTARAVPIERPEQKQTEHDRSDLFNARKARPSSSVFEDQPKEGQISGFDFYRDPLNADKPNQDPAEIVKKESANKPKVMEAQRELLERRYNLDPKLDPEAKMSRGKPVAVGPTARLPEGMSWERLAELRPEEIKQQGIFPYPSLPHPLQSNGGQV